MAREVSPAHALAKSRGMLTQEDVDHLIDLASRLSKIRPVKVVDLGAASGNKVLAILEGRPSRVTVMTIDPDTDELDWAGLAVKNVGRERDWVGTVGPYAVIPPHLAGQKVDLLLVDGDRCGSLKQVLDTWLPLLRDGGVLWVHDYKTYRGNHKVQETVDKYAFKGSVLDVRTVGLGWSANVTESKVEPVERLKRIEKTREKKSDTPRFRR